MIVCVCVCQSSVNMFIVREMEYLKENRTNIHIFIFIEIKLCEHSLAALVLFCTS